MDNEGRMMGKLPVIDLPKSNGIPEKMNLLIEFWPNSGRYSIRIYDGGRLVPDPNPVLLQNAPGMDKPATPLEAPQDVVIRLTKKIIESVQYGLNNSNHIKMISKC